MEIDIYKVKKSSDSAERKYILVPKGFNIAELPNNLKQDLGDLEHKRTIVINRGEKRIALDTDEAIKNIELKGYHIQGAKIEFRIPA
jgi:uncharacterized protein YcgL (UPF0745 family)